MRKYEKYLIIVGITGMGCLLFYLSAIAWGSFIWTKNTVMFYLEEPINNQEALSIIEQSQEKSEQEKSKMETISEFCIWGEKEDVILTNKNLYRNTQVNAIILCGNPELLFEDCRVPGKEDKQGCLIDEETAWELFGSTQVVGKEVFIEDNSYIIRKVISGKNKIIAFQISHIKNKIIKQDISKQKQIIENIFSRITVKKPENCSIRDLYYAWNNQYNFSVKILDTELLRGISGFCVLLIPITICIFFGVYLFYQYKKQELILGKIIIAGTIFILIILALFLLESWIKIPYDYFPEKWSDFSFWARLWKEKKEAIQLIVQISKSNLDYEWIINFFQSIVFSFLAELFLIAGGILSLQKKYS